MANRLYIFMINIMYNVKIENYLIALKLNIETINWDLSTEAEPWHQTRK